MNHGCAISYISVVQCDVPPITNGSVSGCPTSSANYGDECIFTCYDGLKSADDETDMKRTCEAAGWLSGGDLVCDGRSLCVHNCQIVIHPCY